MQFLYFIPNASKDAIQLDQVIAAGLGDVLRDRLTPSDLAGSGRLAIGGASNGPGGHNGVVLQCLVPNVFTPSDEDQPPPVVGYYPKLHTWQPAATGNAAYWIGYDPHALPAPEDLARDNSVSGYFETLGDGREWLCPVIRQYLGQVNLPDVWRVVNGQIVSTVKPDWQGAWELSGQIWESHVSRSDPDVATAMLWCCKLLGINYRIGPMEASLLGLLGRDEYPNVLRAAIHGPGIEPRKAALKKSESPVGPPESTSRGSGDSPPNTAPPVASCISSPTVSEIPGP